MKKTLPSNLQLTLIVRVTKERCYWCGQQLRECGMCKASGKYRGENCTACLATGWMCPTHEGDWPQS